MIQQVQAIPRYTIAVCKGSALLEETKTLLRAWKPGESLPAFRDRVLRQDLLGKATAYRVNDIVRRVFARRLMVPDTGPAVRLKRLLQAGRTRLVSDLLLLYAARQDDTLRGVIVELYWPAIREGRLTLSPSDVVRFLRQAEADGKIAEPWSPQVTVRVARGLLRALAGFGLLREIRRGRREALHFHPDDSAIVYLAYDLHFAGLTDAAVLEHRDWRLFGFRRADAASALDRLSSDAWWFAQIAGSVARISWKHASMEEVIHALAR